MPILPFPAQRASCVITAIAVGCLLLPSRLPAQRKTLSTTDVWTSITGDQRIHPRAVFNFNVEERRSNTGDIPRQLLLLGALMFDIGGGRRAGFGYGHVHSSPVEDLGIRRRSSEHRIYQQITGAHQAFGVTFNHRLRWEQRWLSTEPLPGVERDWTYTSRVRHQLRAIVPLDGKRGNASSLYLVPQTELFLRTTHHVGTLFDQNRIGVSLGVGTLPRLNLEAGFLRQSQIRADGIHQLNHTIQIQGRLLARPR